MKRPCEWLKGLTIHQPQIAQGFFAVFPLTVSGVNERWYLTLDEAVKQGLAFIPETGRVPEIIVVVKGEKPVLVVEGTVIVGGLQNRTVNISLLLEAGKEHRIPVSCVERGRWSFRRRFGREPVVLSWERDSESREEEATEVAFEVAAYTAHLSLRRSKTASAVRNLWSVDKPIADQGAVWSEIERKLLSAQVSSPTRDETDFYEHHRTTIEDLLRPIELLENQVGAAVAIGQDIVGVEVFDHPETWQVVHRKILSGYAADALENLWLNRREEPVGIDGVKAFFELVVTSVDKAYVKPAPVGLGEHYLFSEDATLVGGFALVHNDSIVHLFAYPTSPKRW